MVEDKNWLERFHASLNEVRSAQLALEQVSESLYRVGMTKLADEMGQSLTVIQDAGDQMRTAIHDKIDEDLKEAQDRSGELLKAILDGRMEDAVTRFREVQQEKT